MNDAELTLTLREIRMLNWFGADWVDELSDVAGPTLGAVEGESGGTASR